MWEHLLIINASGGARILFAGIHILVALVVVVVDVVDVGRHPSCGLTALVASLGLGGLLPLAFPCLAVRDKSAADAIPTLVPQVLLRHLGGGPVEWEALLGEVGVGLAGLERDMSTIILG